MSGYKVNFGATDAGFSGTVSKIKSSLNSMDDNVRKVEKSMSSSFSAMAVAGGAFAAGMTAINAGISLVKSSADNFAAAMDMGGALSDLSGRTGETAGNLLILQRAFDNTGAGAEKVGPTINRLQKALVEAGQGASGPTEAFNRLGINFEELAGKTPTEQLQELAAKLSDVQDPAERSTLAMQLLGKSGGELLPLFSGFSEEVQTAKDQLGSLPEVMDRSAGAFDQLGDGIEVVKGKATELAAGFLESLLPALNQLVGAGSTFDAAELGKKFGMSIAPIVEAITSGDIWEIFTLNAQLAIAKIENSDELNNLAATVGAIGKMFMGDFDFTANFAKFKDEMEDAGLEAIDVIEDRLDELWGSQGQKVAETTAKFASEIAKASAEKAAEEIFASLQTESERVEKLFDEAEKINKAQDEATSKIKDSTIAIKDNLREGADSMMTAAEAIKESLSLSEQIVNRINDAEAKSRIDRGGKLEGRINDAINSGDFRKARREADKLREAEDEQKIRDFFTDDPFAKTTSKIKMSLKDLARKEGVETFGKTPDEIRDALLEKMREREKGLDAKQRGKTKEEAAKDGKGPPAADPMKVIVNTVEQIKQLLAKIEPKLPTPALGA
jgi:methyl-accepting chemotaxis protein